VSHPGAPVPPIAADGEVDASSLFVRFGFTRARFEEDSAAWRKSLPGGPASRPAAVATYVHELAHYLQYTTTPYGLFLHYCRLLQNQAAIELVRALFAAGAEVTLPLSLQPVPPTAAASGVARAALAEWWNIENVVAAFSGDGARRADLMAAYAGGEDARSRSGAAPPPLADLAMAFARIQVRIGQFIAAFNAAGAGVVPDTPLFPDGIDRGALDAAAAAPPARQDLAADRVAAAMDLLGDPWDASAIIESAAKVAEFWRTDITRERLATWANKAVDPALTVYRTCLLRGLDAIDTPDMNAFTLSYMALCELTLFAPLLPQHAALRGRAPGLETLLPARRFTNLLSVAGKVAPMSGRADHGRYVNALCEALDWPAPEAMVQLALQAPERVRNPVAFLYQSAQRWRAWDSTAFLGVDALLWNPSDFAQRWRTTFDFVIAQYADGVRLHPDGDFVRSMTVRYLEMLGLQTIMRGETLRIRAPYAGDAGQIQEMTSYLQRRFATLFPGRDFSGVEFVSA
jgi:hypothetical protein